MDSQSTHNPIGVLKKLTRVFESEPWSHQQRVHGFCGVWYAKLRTKDMQKLNPDQFLGRAGRPCGVTPASSLSLSWRIPTTTPLRLSAKKPGSLMRSPLHCHCCEGPPHPMADPPTTTTPPHWWMVQALGLYADQAHLLRELLWMASFTFMHLFAALVDALSRFSGHKMWVLWACCMWNNWQESG